MRDYSDVAAVFPLQTYAITGVSIGADEFVVAGDQRERFLVGGIFVVADSTGNDGTYTIATVVFAASETTIGVSEDVTDATVDGDILHDEIADELGMTLSHDNATDRDAETPDQIAGAHVQRLTNEIRALCRTLGTGIGFAIVDGGGLDILFSSGTIVLGSGTPNDGVPGKLTLADDDISYVEVNASAVVSANTVGFSNGKYPLAIVTTASGAITNIEDKRSAIYIAEFGEANLDDFGPEFNPATELTIAAGVITRTQGVHRIDTQSDDASDELDTINGGVDGMMLFIRAENDARTVIIKDGTGNIESAGGDITLDNTKQFVQLQYDAALSKWVTVWGADRETLVHALGGAEHSVDTLANLNSKVSDATLIDTADSRLSDDRTPLSHALAGAKHSADTLANLNGLISDATLIGAANLFQKGGEAGGADRTLGNTDNFDLGFITNNLTRIHIQNDGKIGIGRTDPSGILDIFSDTSSVAGHIILQSSTNNTAASGHRIEWLNASAGSVAWIDAYNPGVPGYLSMGVYGAEMVRIESNGTVATLKVGIGTTSPNTKLHLVDPNTNVDYITLDKGSGYTDGDRHDIAWSDGTQVTARIGVGHDLSRNTVDFFVSSLYDSGAQTARLFIVEAGGSVMVGSGIAAGMIHVDQSDSGGAIPVLYLDQADISEEMIEFNTTIGVGNAIEAIGAKTLTTTHFIKVTVPGGLTRYFPVGTIA